MESFDQQQNDENDIHHFDRSMKIDLFKIHEQMKKYWLVITSARCFLSLSLSSLLIIEFSSPTLAVMQSTPNTGPKVGKTTRLRTPFLPPIPARWMMHNDGSLRTASAKKSTSESDLNRMGAWANHSYPTNASSVFS